MSTSEIEKKKWEQLSSKDFTDSFAADAVQIFSLQPVVTSENLVFSKRNSGVRKCCDFVVKFTAARTKLLCSNLVAKASIREY